MNPYLRIACLLVLACPLAAIGWDLLMLLLGVKGASFCQGCRQLNAASDGLLALLWLFGGAGLWIHVFLLPLLPAWWRH